MADISKLNEALRTRSTRREEVTFATDDGGFTQMVHIPKFRVPAGMWEAGAFRHKTCCWAGSSWTSTSVATKPPQAQLGV